MIGKVKSSHLSDLVCGTWTPHYDRLIIRALGNVLFFYPCLSVYPDVSWGDWADLFYVKKYISLMKFVHLLNLAEADLNTTRYHQTPQYKLQTCCKPHMNIMLFWGHSIAHKWSVKKGSHQFTSIGGNKSKCLWLLYVDVQCMGMSSKCALFPSVSLCLLCPHSSSQKHAWSDWVDGDCCNVVLSLSVSGCFGPSNKSELKSWLVPVSSLSVMNRNSHLCR